MHQVPHYLDSWLVQKAGGSQLPSAPTPAEGWKSGTLDSGRRYWWRTGADGKPETTITDMSAAAVEKRAAERKAALDRANQAFRFGNYKEAIRHCDAGSRISSNWEGRPGAVPGQLEDLQRIGQAARTRLAEAEAEAAREAARERKAACEAERAARERKAVHQMAARDKAARQTTEMMAAVAMLGLLAVVLILWAVPDPQQSGLADVWAFAGLVATCVQWAASTAWWLLSSAASGSCHAAVWTASAAWWLLCSAVPVLSNGAVWAVSTAWWMLSRSASGLCHAAVWAASAAWWLLCGTAPALSNGTVWAAWLLWSTASGSCHAAVWAASTAWWSLHNAASVLFASATSTSIAVVLSCGALGIASS
eukprot:SAG22_NODE_722_length_7641_cov_13.307876_7_plen_365_part_00